MNKKLNLLATLLAMLLPTMLFAGGGGTTTYDYSATVSVTASGNGTVYVGTTNPPSDKTKKSASQSDSGLSDTSKAYTFYAVAEPDSGYEFTGWTGGADNASSATTPVTVSLSSSTTSKTVSLTATFAKVVTFDGAEYVIDENGGDLATLLGTVQDGDKIIINKDVTIEKGVNLTIPSGIQVTISSGKKLIVKGNLSIHKDARLVGEGTLAHNWKTITQAADVHVPFPLGTDGVAGTGNGVNTVDGTAGKYLVTSVAEANNVSGSFTCKDEFFVAVENKASGETYYSKPSTSKPVGVLCTVAREKALNWIEGVSETVYTDCATLLTASATPSASGTHEVKDTNKLSVLLANAGTVSYSDTANSSSALGFAVDLAGCSLTLTSKSAKSQWNSLKLVRFFNGSVTISQKVMNTNFCVYNMSGTFSYLSGSSYYTAISFYDSPSVKVSWNDLTSETPAGGQNYYGGGTYNTTNAKFQTTPKTKFNTVYWGTFASGMNPTSYLYDTNKVYAEQDPKQSNAWVVKEVYVDPNAGQVLVNGEESSLANAIANAPANAEIVLQKDIELESNLTLAASGVRIDLNGWKLTGSNAIINNGDLEIIDVNGNGQIDVPVINNGTLLLSSAKYNGMITLNSGFCYFLAGTFNGGVAVASSVEDAKSVTEVCGGMYATLTYVHGGKNENLVDLCDNGYVKDNAIAPIPVSYVTNPSQGSYSLSAFDGETKSLYTRNAARSGYTREEWVKLCKLKAASALFSGFGVDCAVTFDRDVAANDLSVTAMGLYTFSIDEAIAANKSFSALFQAMRRSGMATAPWTYGSILPGGNHDGSLSFSISPNSTQNGTRCLIEMRLATGIRNMSGPMDWSYTEYVTTATRKFVFGAGTNKAMIRPEVGAATFYATVTGALAAAEDGATVMLTQDCEEDVVLAKVGSFTIDQNGFALTGTVAAGGDYFVEAAEGGTYTVAKKGIVDENGNAQASIQDVVNAAVESEAAEVSITIPETTSEQTVELPQDTTLTVVQAEGSETVVNVTPAVGYFVEATVVEPTEEQSGTTTVYESKKITEEVVRVTEESVQELNVKLEEVQSGSTETIEVTEVAQIVEAVNNLMGNKALERADNVEQAKSETINLKAIVITPKAIVQEVQASATEEKVVKAAAFDVTPTDANDNKIENTSFTFRLPVADGMTGSMVVFHEKAFFGVYPILSWSDGAKNHKYIEITSSEFSEYSYEPRRGIEYAIAKIGDTGYDSLEDAVADATAGAKVELLASTTLTNEIAVAKAVTLDLGEYTVSAASGKSAIQVAAGGNLTIEATTGGITAASGFAVYTDYELSQGVKVVTINGGTFSGVQFNKYPLQTSAAQSGEAATPTTVAINGGTFSGTVKIYRCPTTIAGGTFEQGLDTSSSSVSVYSNSKTPVRVIGGKFKTEPVSVGNRVFVNAGYYEGGYFVVGDTALCQAKRNGKFYRYATEAFAAVGADTRIEILNGADVSGINVTLGEGQSLTVSSSFTAVAAANGYTLRTDVNTADGTVTYTAYVDGAVARIGGEHYTTLDAAFAAAQDGDTITLVADATLGVTAISADVTLALAEHNVTIATAGINLAGKLTVTGVGLVSAIPSVTGKGELVILGGTWTADPSAFVPQVVTALPGEQDDKAWTKDRCYVFANKAFVDGGWGDAEGFYTVVPLPKAYVTAFSEKPEVGGYGALDCAYTFESFSSANGDDAIAAKFLEGGFSAFSDPVELARAKELLMEKMPFLDWNADFVVSLDGAADAGDLVLSGHYAQWDIGWVSYESPERVESGEKVRLLVDIGQATPGDWPYENICRYVRTFDCGAKKLKSAMDGKTMTVQLRLYKPGEDEGLGAPSILICEYKYTFGGYAAKIVRGNETLRYTTLADAFAAVQANETILLLNDYTGAVDLTGCDVSFTLDKNGFGLAIEGEPTTEADWFFEKMTNGNWFHYYKKPAAEDTAVATVEVVDEDGETMSLAPITVPDDWVTENVKEGETTEEALAKVEENGLLAWQNYVIGQDPSAAVRVDTEQAPIAETPIANTLAAKVDVPANSGFKVTYALDKVEVNGTVVEGEPQNTAENFTIDLASATDNDAGAAYFKMTAIIEAEDGTGAKTKVASENTIGVLKVESSAKSTVIAVPWESLAANEQDITVSNLVRTATLTEGDELKVYDTATGKYRAWTLTASKEWEPMTVVGGASSEDAGGSTIARGSGVWLTRTDTTKPIYLVGEVAEQTTTTTIAGANEEKPTWNLVAAPTVEAVNLNEKFPAANEGDVVLVPTAGAPKRYTFKDGAWGYDEYVTTVNKKGVAVVKVVRNTDVTNVPIGTGFWYMNAGDDQNVEW